jgi:hypothetical protein
MTGNEKKNTRWTPRRIVRSAGTTAISTAVLMALYGAYGLGVEVSARAFYIYWTVFFVFLMGALALAIMDALITVAKFKQDRESLKKTAGGTPNRPKESGNGDARPKG